MTTLDTKQPICLPSLRILSDYWTLRVIDELSSGDSLRFNEIERRIEGVNTATLSKRLKDMQQDLLITRTENTRADVAYKLTELGLEAVPLLKAVNHFSEAKQKSTQQTTVKASV